MFNSNSRGECAIEKRSIHLLTVVQTMHFKQICERLYMYIALFLFVIIRVVLLLSLTDILCFLFNCSKKEDVRC